jgi:FtsZ family, C-terminal domain
VAEGQDRAVEAARRALSSPLLEGASVTGARGVIINVTGGPDLSLVEVSEASSIVQEAADEDANIIFGAVVDPLLKGKVKITVIATGFGGPAVARSTTSAATAVTPVDMTQYADHARVRNDSIAVAAGGRLSLARRPLIDLTSGVGSGAAASKSGAAAKAQGSSSPPSSGAGNGSGEHAVTPSFALGDDGYDTIRAADKADGVTRDADLDLSSTFDVPAFLRRQEG